MKFLFIGADPQTVEAVGANLAHRWPGAKTAQRAKIEDSLELVEGSSPDAVQQSEQIFTHILYCSDCYTASELRSKERLN